MANFKLFLLTPDIEKEHYFIDTLSIFNGQFYAHNNNSAKDSFSRWEPDECNERDNNWTLNEKFTVHQNAQKELSFDMPTRIMINNDWKINLFVRKIHIGSLLLLIDKYDNHHVFVVKGIQTKLSDINTTYSYSCQDAFSYSLTRQNEGYFINNDPSSTDFIGAKTIDWWAEKIIKDCYITDVYVKTNECLYSNFDGKMIKTEKHDNILDNLKVYKQVDPSINTVKTTTFSDQLSTTTEETKPIFNEAFTFSCSDSTALNALISLGDQVGYLLNVCERARFYDSRVKIDRFFWFEPSKIDTVSPYYYSPKKNIESFSFNQSGSSLTTVLNIKSHLIGEELITMIPTPTPLFAQWFQSIEWKQTKYSRGFFTDHLNGKIWTTEGLNPSLNEVYGLEKAGKIIADNVAYYEDGGYIRIPITDYQKNTIELGYWDSKIQFSSPTRPTYFYIQHGDEGSIFTNKSFACWLEIKKQSEHNFTIIQEHERIPAHFKNTPIEMFLVFQNTFKGDQLSFYSTPEINLYSYSDITEADRQFATLADKAPWLENKIVDFQYFVNKGVLTKREYEIVMDNVLNELRIVNGQLLCYAQQYQNALKGKASLLANLELAAETLHAELEQDGISPYFEEGAAKDLSDFILKNNQLKESYSKKTQLYGAHDVQNNYFNKYFSSQQRFLKNIYRFTDYFNSTVSEEEQESQAYTFKLKPGESDHYISFAPNNFISCMEMEPTPSDKFYMETSSNVFKEVSVATPDNIRSFWMQNIKSEKYTPTSDIGETKYNSNCKYFIKNTTELSDFITSQLQGYQPVRQAVYDKNGIQTDTIEYYALNESLLKQFYYYKLFKACYNDSKILTLNNIYIKDKPAFVSIGDRSDLNIDTVYMKVGSDYKPIQYQNPNSTSFNGWREKTAGERHVSPYGSNSNPYDFMAENDPGIYLTKGYDAANKVYYIDARSFIESRRKRWTEYKMENCTYDNHYKHRVATEGTITSENITITGASWALSGSQNEEVLYVPNIRYEAFEGLTMDLSGRHDCFLGLDLGESSILACRRDFTPIPLKESSFVYVPTGYKIYEYKDFDAMIPEHDGLGIPSNLNRFYSETVYLENSVFNPLVDKIIIDVVDGQDVYANFLDICSELYVVFAEDIEYTEAKGYDIQEQYFKKLSDNSFIAVPLFDDIKSSSLYYVENNMELTLNEWGLLMDKGEKNFFLKIYLHQATETGYNIIDRPSLLKVSVPVKDGQLSGEEITIGVNHLGFYYDAVLTCSSKQNLKNNGKMSNGTFWYKYIDSTAPEDVLYQEKALIIEQQLTEYWNQAYLASKYCDWFIPRSWTQNIELQNNNFFKRLFSIDNGIIVINNQIIPEVDVVGSEETIKRPQYQITYDPLFRYADSSGLLASDIEGDNLAFLALSEELLGSDLNNMTKFKLTPIEGATTTYYYVKSGGCRWNNILSYIGQTSTKLNDFTGLYGLMFKWSNNFEDTKLLTYDYLLESRQSVWKGLHEKYPFVFYEGVFEYPTATSSDELYQMAYYAFKDKSKPETEYSITILDAYSLKGYSGEDIRVGYPILIDATEYQLENIQAQKAIDQYLFITDISYSLRSDLNISITVNSIKYDDKLIERLVKFIR